MSGFPLPLAGLEVDHPATPPRCLGSTGHYTALVALVEKQQHVLSDLKREQVSGQVADTMVII